jgi:TolA-binding protein
LHEKINTISSKMEDFKQYITPEMDNADRKTLGKIQEGLTGLRLEKKVAEAAELRRVLQRRRRIQRLITLAIALLISGVLAFYFIPKNETNATPENIPQKQETTPPKVENQVPTLPKTPIETPSKPITKPEPIAQRPRTKSEEIQQPLIRSAQSELDKNTQQILQSALSETEKLNGFESGSNWSKAIDLLKKGKPLEANPYIFSLETEDEKGKMEAKWLLGVSLLSKGKIEDAVAIFEKISKKEDHIRQELAKKVLKNLE